MRTAGTATSAYINRHRKPMRATQEPRRTTNADGNTATNGDLYSPHGGNGQAAGRTVHDK